MHKTVAIDLDAMAASEKTTYHMKNKYMYYTAEYRAPPIRLAVLLTKAMSSMSIVVFYIHNVLRACYKISSFDESMTSCGKQNNKYKTTFKNVSRLMELEIL